MIPPLNITLEIGQSFLRGGEAVIEHLVAPMPVIALAGLIVITKHALLVYDIGQTVFEGMRRGRQGLRQAPQNQLRELVLGMDDALTEKLCGLHVGDNANRNPLLSTTPTPVAWD
jgi:hypothetical protein